VDGWEKKFGKWLAKFVGTIPENDSDIFKNSDGNEGQAKQFLNDSHHDCNSTNGFLYVGLCRICTTNAAVICLIHEDEEVAHICVCDECFRKHDWSKQTQCLCCEKKFTKEWK